MSNVTRGKAAQEKQEDKPGMSAESSKTNPQPKVHKIETQKTKDVKVASDAFQVVFYMKHFRVTDIIVKVVNGSMLVIDACHREHADEHGLVSRSMIRQHNLPNNVDVKTLVSSFTGNGFLVIHAEWKDKKGKQK